MRRELSATIIVAVALLSTFPVVVAHGIHHDASPVNETLERYNRQAGQQNSTISLEARSYFSYDQHVVAIYAHICLMVTAWVFILPLAIMNSIAQSKWTLSAQVLFLVVNKLGLLAGVFYNASTPDLYENNSHGNLGWLVASLTLLWPLIKLLHAFAGRKNSMTDNYQEAPLLTASMMAKHQILHLDRPSDPTRWSGDSGQGTERNSASLCEDSQCSSIDLQNARWYSQQGSHSVEEENDEGNEYSEHDDWQGSAVRLSVWTVEKAVLRRRFRIALSILYVILERALPILGFVVITTGSIIFGGIARGNHIYNILAHFIKGGIFFWYGLLTLGRWMGCFGDLGWSWNIKPGPEVVGRIKSRVPTAEFTESFVIWLYGASNVFLEHLAAWGGTWTAQDLEHISISIMFFGGGLFGMLIESRRVRDWIGQTMQFSPAAKNRSEEFWSRPPSYKAPMNPTPALVILLLGVMMSSHHQSSMLSTMVHKQWGTMFVGFAFARAVTYVLLYISPPSSYLPARPPSEIITSFCLIAGGLLFMESNKDTIAALESFELDAMFTFTITMGFTCLLMAWLTSVVAYKGWLTRDSKASSFASNLNQQISVLHRQA